jgi:hypothetical protein
MNGFFGRWGAVRARGWLVNDLGVQFGALWSAERGVYEAGSSA